METGYVIKNLRGEYLWVTPEGAFAWTDQPKWALRLLRVQDAQMLSIADKHTSYIGAVAAIEPGPEITEDLQASPESVAKAYGREEL